MSRLHRVFDMTTLANLKAVATAASVKDWLDGSAPHRKG
jgi:hypothetical protein